MKVVIAKGFRGFALSEDGVVHMAKLGSERAQRELARAKKEGRFFGYGTDDDLSVYDRADPLLVETVEDLGEKAGQKYSKLAVVEVQEPYRIEEVSELVKTSRGEIRNYKEVVVSL